MQQQIRWTKSRKTIRLISLTIASMLIFACNDAKNNSQTQMASSQDQASKHSSNNITYVTDAPKTSLNNNSIELKSPAEINNLKDSVTTNEYTSSTTPYSSNKSQYLYAASGNKINMYHIESSGALKPLSTPSITTPEASGSVSGIAITQSSKFAYAIINTNSSSSKIFMLHVNDNGNLIPFTASTVSTSPGANSIALAKDGRFAYITSPTQICTYPIESATGTITPEANSCQSYGYTNFTQIVISANNKYAFVTSGTNQDVILSFKRNPETGSLTNLSPLYSGVNNRSMVTPQETGKFIYSALKSNSAAGQYKIESSSGKVLPLSPQSEKTGTDAEPHAIAITPDGKYVYVTNYHNNNISMFIVNTNGTLHSPSLGVISAASGPDKVIIDQKGEFVYVSTIGNKNLLQYKISQDSGVLTQINNAVTLNESISYMAIASISPPKIVLENPGRGETLDVNGLESIVFECTECTEDLDPLSVIAESTLKFTQTTYESPIDTLSNEVHTNTAAIAIPITVAAISVVGTSVIAYLQANQLKENSRITAYECGWKTIAAIAARCMTMNFSTQSTSSSPTVIVPKPPYTHVDTKTQIVIKFKNPVIASTVNNDSFKLFKITQYGKEEVPAPSPVVSPNGITGTLTPTSALDSDSDYSAETTDGIIGAETGLAISASATKITTDSSKTRKLKIYTATNRGAGYPPSSGLSTYDYICQLDPNIPIETDDGPPPVYKALLGSRGNQGPERYPSTMYEGEKTEGVDWPLKENTSYYNKRNNFIATTNDMGVFGLRDAPIYGHDNSLSSFILPLTHIGVWTGVNVNLDFTEPYDEKDENWYVYHDLSCNQWTTEDANVEGIVGRGDFDTEMNINLVFSGQRNRACNGKRAIYCVQQS